MPISTESSTFEYCRDWLVSSDCFVRDAMGAELPALDDARNEARARIHREEAYDQPNEEEENETAPDLPPSVNDRPRAIVITRNNDRERVGTGTWGGRGQLLVCLEVPIPTEHLIADGDTEAQKAAKFAATHVWADQLAHTIRLELMATSGIGDQDGTRYLNATKINLFVAPGFPEDGEFDSYMAWIYEVEWM